MIQDLNHNIVDAEIIDEQNYSQNKNQQEDFLFETNLPAETTNYLSYLVDSARPAVRKTLRNYGYPMPYEEVEGFEDELYDLLIHLVQEKPESYEYLISQSPQFEVAKKIIEKQKTKKVAPKFKNFLTKATNTNDSSYELLIAKNRHTTNMIIIGVAAITTFLIFSNKI